ncbi:hypothetical protein VTP01DRAFT_2000 [Rhizomucor pusillus]|uniref:40S ribosomal uS13 domain-containing protein n=1 Tax=Rhizomucor pusillus TaxID=4840 RepID=UPI0037440402
MMASMQSSFSKTCNKLNIGKNREDDPKQSSSVAQCGAKQLELLVHGQFQAPKSRQGLEGLQATTMLDLFPRKWYVSMTSLVVPERNQFQHILRLLNTNVDGKNKITIALTSVKGVGRRFANIACKKADVDLNKRAGELSNEELERIVTILQNPSQYKIPNWFLNRQKDVVDGKYSQAISNTLDTKMREDLERLKKIRAHRGLRHFWGLRVRGQHTKTTGRRGRTVGVSKKK